MFVCARFHALFVCELSRKISILIPGRQIEIDGSIKGFFTSRELPGRFELVNVLWKLSFSSALIIKERQRGELSQYHRRKYARC